MEPPEHKEMQNCGQHVRMKSCRAGQLGPVKQFAKMGYHGRSSHVLGMSDLKCTGDSSAVLVMCNRSHASRKGQTCTCRVLTDGHGS